MILKNELVIQGWQSTLKPHVRLLTTVVHVKPVSAIWKNSYLLRSRNDRPSSGNSAIQLDEPYIKEVAERVRDQVYSFCEKNGFAFTGRIKTRDSVAEKLETGRYQSWVEVDDLYACAVVVPTLLDEVDALNFLEERYEQVEVRKRGSTQKDPTVFRFDATRFIGRLRADERLDDASPLRKILFEVQIRSAFEHAWSVTTHALAYKSDEVNWRRLRLVAQLKAAVEQLDGLVLGFDAAADEISEHRWPEVAAKKKIESTFLELIEAGSLPDDAAPQSWARFCENLFRIMMASSSGFVGDKEKFVEESLNDICQVMAAYGKDKYPRSLTLTQYCMICLLECGRIKKPLRKYTPLITDEMLSLFPDSGKIGAGFDFS